MDENELQDLADQLGCSPEEAAAYLDFLDEEEAKDAAHEGFLDENDIEGLDLDSGEFY